MDVVTIVLVAIVGVPIGSLLNRLIVREPGYVITDPGDLPEGADPALLDELEPEPDVGDVPMLAIVRPDTWWRRWFPVTELVTAALFGLTVHRFGRGSLTAAVLFLVASLIVMAAVDFRVYRIPDRINFPSMAIGLAAICAVSVYQGVPGAIFGAVAGGASYAGMLALAHIVYPRGMGWGDVKLAWLMGFYLGWIGWQDGDLVSQYVYALRFVLFGAALGSLFGVIIGGGYALVRRSAKVVFPYGPSLAAGCLVVVLWASALR